MRFFLVLNKENNKCQLVEMKEDPRWLKRWRETLYFLKSLKENSCIEYKEVTIEEIVFTMLDPIQESSLKFETDINREHKVREAVKIGLLQKETADMLGISPRRLTYYTDKFDCRNSAWAYTHKEKPKNILKLKTG